LEWGKGFDGVSQTGQPVAPDLPAADSLELRCPFPAMGENLLNDRRVFDVGESLPRERSECFGDHLHTATAFTAGFDIA